MKINISKTELNALPHIAWDKFTHFMSENQKNEALYTPIQKTATLCFWYHSKIYVDGHSAYFNHPKQVDSDELLQAFRTIGAPEFADHLIEAAQYGQEDDYHKIDAWFEENESELLEAIEAYVREYASEFYEIVDEDYTMRQSKQFFWSGVVIAVLSLASLAFFLIVSADGAGIIICLAALGLVGILIAVYTEKWSISVKKDTFTVYRLFRQPRQFHLDEISKVRQTSLELIVYVVGKKAFKADGFASDFELFEAQLYEAGKMESTQNQSSFVVRKYTGNLIGTVGSIPILCGVMIWSVFQPDDHQKWFACFFLSVILLLSLWMIIQYLLWRITVSDDTITIKKLGGENQYRMRDITKINIVKADLVLYAGDQKIVKVGSNCSDYLTLAERLANENIPFYQKGQLMERIPRFPKTF